MESHAQSIDEHASDDDTVAGKSYLLLCACGRFSVLSPVASDFVSLFRFVAIFALSPLVLFRRRSTPAAALAAKFRGIFIILAISFISASSENWSPRSYHSNET
ncbi:hypothetical protein Y032_0141g2253 [Ancylostoma ceylanicum]|nr:hypothetical protein Y032_0141g2253 [Ancylostoma ceylanicum]